MIPLLNRDTVVVGGFTQPTRSEKRKALEFALVREIEKHLVGLDVSYIAIDLKDGVDVRVTLNEATKIEDQTTSKNSSITKIISQELGAGTRR